MLTRSITSLALLLGLAGCGSKGPSDNEPKQPPAAAANSTPAADHSSNMPDPCKLITKEEAQQILGEPVRDPEPNSLGGVRICDFRSVKIHGGITPYSVHIAIAPETRNAWDSGKKLHMDAKEARPVAGIGEDAYFLLDDLDVFSKQLSMTINVMKDVDRPSHAKSVQDAEKMVAEKALPRL